MFIKILFLWNFENINNICFLSVEYFSTLASFPYESLIKTSYLTTHLNS